MNLPGTPRLDMSPQEVLVELERLKSKLHPFLSSPEAVSAKPEPVRVPSGRVPKCFVIMPFGNGDLNVVYEDFVRPVLVDRCNLECKRGDDIFGTNVIMNDIRQAISDSDFAVADLTGQNAN